MVICPKKQKNCLQNELIVGDCWIGMTQAQGSGLILATRVGKHTDEFIAQLVVNTQGNDVSYKNGAGLKPMSLLVGIRVSL